MKFLWGCFNRTMSLHDFLLSSNDLFNHLKSRQIILNLDDVWTLKAELVFNHLHSRLVPCSDSAWNIKFYIKFFEMAAIPFLCRGVRFSPKVFSHVCFEHFHNEHRNISGMKMPRFNHGINPWQHKNKNNLFKVLQNINLVTSNTHSG